MIDFNPLKRKYSSLFQRFSVLFVSFSRILESIRIKENISKT